MKCTQVNEGDGKISNGVLLAQALEMRGPCQERPASVDQPVASLYCSTSVLSKKATITSVHFSRNFYYTLNLLSTFKMQFRSIVSLLTLPLLAFSLDTPLDIKVSHGYSCLNKNNADALSL